MAYMNEHRDYPSTPSLPPSRRSSSASEMSSSTSRRSDSDTEVTTPLVTPDFKLSPHFTSTSAGPNGIAELAIAPSSHRRSLEISPSSSPQCNIKSHPADASYFLSRSRHSFDSKAYHHPTNAYAASPTYAHHSYLGSEPYHYPRQRADSSPNNYSATPGYPHHSSSHYNASHSVPHSPQVFRSTTQMFSSPPTSQDRRKAHILSEQKRRESINGGFEELKHLLNSEPITRALSSSSHNSIDHDSDSKINFDTNSFLGGGNRESKAATLRKAVRAITVLADALNEKDSELAMLRKELSAIDCNAVTYNKRGSVIVHDLTLQDNDMKLEDGS